jgi:hypothetical protein
MQEGNRRGYADPMLVEGRARIETGLPDLLYQRDC